MGGSEFEEEGPEDEGGECGADVNAVVPEELGDWENVVLREGT